MEEVIMPLQSMFVGHCDLQHAGLEWNGSHRLRHHVFFIPSDMQPKEAIAFAYKSSLTAAATTQAD